MEKIVMIVAGGSGTRMNSGIPKQFLLINDRPILMHTIRAIYDYDHRIQLRLILPESQTGFWKDLCINYKFDISHEIGHGGETRFHTVKNNLKDIPDDALVAVHDGVRPLVSRETIERCFSTAEKTGIAVPCVDIPETMRRISKGNSMHVNRMEYKLIQTPQVFRGDILKKAYHTEYRDDFTDDASVVEFSGYTITLVEGNTENIKITFEKDMIIAGALLERQIGLQGL